MDSKTFMISIRTLRFSFLIDLPHWIKTVSNPIVDPIKFLFRSSSSKNIIKFSSSSLIIQIFFLIHIFNIHCTSFEIWVQNQYSNTIIVYFEPKYMIIQFINLRWGPKWVLIRMSPKFHQKSLWYSYLLASIF